MFKKLLICVFCLSVLALAGGGLWLWQGLQTLEQPVALDEPVLFSVPSGSGYGQVARKLEAEGLVGDSLWLKIHGRLYPEQALLKAGEYEFTDGMTSLDMINAMVAGDTKHWQIQFIEGWTFRDMRAALASSERLGQVTADWTDDRIMEEMGRIPRAASFRIPTCLPAVKPTLTCYAGPLSEWKRCLRRNGRPRLKTCLTILPMTL